VQGWDEWVLVLEGSARLRLEGKARSRWKRATIC
jgi:uncharacterized cupin superfamily protein